MAVRTYAIAAALMTCGTSASAGVQTVGSSDARMCFEVADSPTRSAVPDLQRCDDALRSGGLSNYEAAATYVNRGIVRLRIGLIDEAIADFDMASAIDPDQPEAYLNKGAALIRREQSGEAARLFTVALERNTRRPEIALYGRAMANEALGNVRAAYDDYRRASELAPRWREPRLDLARFRVAR